MRKNYAIFMGEPGNEFSTAIVRGAHAAAIEEDANLIIFPSGIYNAHFTDLDDVLYRYQYFALNSFLTSKSIDAGLIEFGTISMHMNMEEKLQYLSKVNAYPVMLLATRMEGYNCISFENSSGIYEAVRHLVENQGCRKIGFLSGPMDNKDAMERLEAYRGAVAKYHLDLDDSWVAYGNFSQYNMEDLEALLDRHPDIEAVACANDFMAFGAYGVAKKRNLLVGKTLKISGFDDSIGARFIEPPLTTVRADASKMSYTALKKLIHGEGDTGYSDLPTELVTRESCGEAATGCASEVFRQDALDRFWELERSRQISSEVELVLHQVLYYQDTPSKWLTAILDTFKRMGCKKSSLFFFSENVVREERVEFSLPETMELRAYFHDGVISTFEKGEKTYPLDTLFHSDVIMMEESSTVLALPLFYCERIIGIIFTECDIDMVQFTNQMVTIISNAIEMIRIHELSMQTQEDLKHANQAKNDFLANMSHEIRTPINAIMGMNEMVLRESNQEEIREYAWDIKNASETLLSIVNDILDFSKMEAGRLEIIPVEYNLPKLLRNTEKQMQPRARAKGLKLSYNITSNLPSTLFGDNLRIEQVLLNIISNAIKYTQKGSVTVDVSATREDKDAILHFAVRDTGIGIEKENIDKLFEKFTRFEEKRNRSIEGTGLGLNITHGFLRMMGSELHVESVYGEGSTFSFDLRQRVVEWSDTSVEIPTHSESKLVQYEAPNARVLLVDDNEINRLVVMKLLGRTKIHIDEAENGKICLEMLAKESYDMVLLDHMMPVMDGMEAFAEARANPENVMGKPVFVALTANAMSGVEQEYLDAGFDSYLSKPIIPKALDALMLRFLPDVRIITDESHS